MELSQAWRQTLGLLSLSTTTVFAVCGLVYLALRRSLRPVQSIVLGLQKLESGELDYRLPEFELKQWRQIASAINQLATSQQQLLEERQFLIGKLQALQELERREIAGELHDEFGQCLAAISAVTTSMKQSAPLLLEDCERIGDICQHMQQTIRQLLQRLRPPEWDELGLKASLTALIANWNLLLAGKTNISLELQGPIASIAENHAMALFRTIQECLTNIAKHANASRANISIEVTPEQTTLMVQDDGKTNQLPFPTSTGIGLLGIRERASALGGTLKLTLNQPHGLCVELVLPVDHPLQQS